MLAATRGIAALSFPATTSDHELALSDRCGNSEKGGTGATREGVADRLCLAEGSVDAAFNIQLRLYT